MTILWEPTKEQIDKAQMTAFRQAVNESFGLELANQHQLWQWSVDRSESFWGFFWDYAGIINTNKGERILIDGNNMLGAKWFPDARLNYAENLLQSGEDQRHAIIFRDEQGHLRRLTYSGLRSEVASVSAALKAIGVQKGDRVAGYLPNIPEAVIAMLATASLGAVWSSCSPDFGVQGVVDRFGQIKPKVLFCADAYFYNGKTYQYQDKAQEVVQQIDSLEAVIIIGFVEQIPDPVAYRSKRFLYQQLIKQYANEPLKFVECNFNDPLFIMFSSGTTGVPKCIVHGIGGTLLQHVKEHRLHLDLVPDDQFFYFTTCGWMMWNWQVSGLASGATIALYDGSPFYPTAALFDYADEIGMTIFGTSAKYIDSVKKSGMMPKQTHSLERLRLMLSTGSPLVPESYDFVYSVVKDDLCLSSISGGTDIISCFALGSTILPVYRGELQCRGLGMAVDAWNEDGRPVSGEKGELVCIKAFPSMPIGFWNDDGSKYRAAYFEHFSNVWYHGDFVEITEHGGMIIYGRSDAVLNPGGVRIGTAEIYRQVETLDEVTEALVIGQDWEDDVRIILFVTLQDNLKLNNALVRKIKQQIRTNCTPRHVPAHVIAVPEIPRTKNGKIVELAVRNVVHDRPVKNIDALANAQALDYYRNIPELSE